ncbi:unnamed protein product [Oppiella nova]|uniref:Uncharacterized protein n=1 Tax=Oppiella nova TaxID=334625 RepID=A0A7R9LZL0_9ACAR|nr:unnamed protein product [Oppiella nova]CAG2168513.1 unnamed protein product [Oppiella nova]
MILNTAKGIIGTIGAVSLVIQLLGLYGAHKEHYNFTMAYGIVSAILAGLCIVSALTGNSVGDWFLMIFFAICASVALQFAREIRRLLNPPLSPNVVYMNNNGQPPYVVPGAQVQSGPMYLTPVTIPGQTGPVYIQSQTGQVVAFPAPGATYVGPADNPPTYRQSQEDISNMSVSAAPGGSDGIANQNVEEPQFGGLWGAYKDHYYISLSYGIGSTLLAGLCIVSAIVGAGGIDWILVIFFAICGSLGCQLSREIKRTNRMPVLNQTVYMNPGIQPNMVYQVPNTGQPGYVVQGGQVQTGPMYMSPTLTAVQSMPAQSGQVFVSSPQYPTSQVVAFPTPGPSYGGSSTSPPTYTQSQEDISRMSVNEQPSGAQGAPGGSNSYLNENIEEPQILGLWGSGREHYYMCLTYGVISILLACLCIVSAIISQYLVIWLLMVVLGFCGSLSCQFAREIRRCDNMPGHTVYMNAAIQPNMVYHISSTGQPPYIMPTAQVPNRPVYATPTLTPVQTIPAHNGQVVVSSPMYDTSQVVAYPTPTPAYVGPSTSPPPYSVPDVDVSAGQSSEAPGGSATYLNENMYEHKTVPN